MNDVFIKTDTPVPLPNSSGQGKDATVPTEVDHWNWGALFFTVVWWVFNVKTTRDSVGELFESVEYWGELTIDRTLARRASALAWKYKRWPSVEGFLRAQRAWTIAGILVPILVVIVFAALVIRQFGA